MCSRAVEHDWGRIFYLCCRIMKKQKDNIMLWSFNQPVLVHNLTEVVDERLNY